jgi:redox-sensitive bicupin YhaK (pirin superfamily)
MTTKTSNFKLIRKEDQFIMNLANVATPNKPIVGGHTADGESSGQLYYWSHSTFKTNFEFGLHPHQGFEIITYILEGQNSHFDTANAVWKNLNTGDLQIIYSGSGLSHNEKVAGGSRAFQIWFDPNYHQALTQQPDYSDHNSESFVTEEVEGIKVTHLVGPKSRVNTRTPGLLVSRYRPITQTSMNLQLDINNRNFIYVIGGSANLDSQNLLPNDLIMVENQSSINLELSQVADIFVISLPATPSYKPIQNRK